MTDAALFETDPVEGPAGTEYRSTAVLSADGLYRYELTREWGRPSGFLTWIMLNPSTADAQADDPTIRRCIGFAKSFGHTGIRVLNLYALRATNPADLWTAPDPVGPENDQVLADELMRATRDQSVVVAAWGANARQTRVDQFLSFPRAASTLRSLGITKDGQPRHPLYLPKTAPLTRWPA
ncbi:DUF1643 domain-containing protein [Nocardioides marmoriginsengisoli]|uniref:DUF1643 domain-containing protein n=1 Tax=Nocardioides marmoriginsengisoli TaxID=661483 RepID=A0A3N0CCH3_9ACTN|nr:DUF1643 domain-containing protein [Nocardioides marmoriginsengisoli]RNL60999.1 DUF1643 domain-containing protein [Nocardioides marmoriginsengisoli]